MGIPADKLNKLFINFGKLEDPNQRNPGGVGLGLSICKSLIETMGGSVSVKSTLGVGTKFILNFRSTCMKRNEDTTVHQFKSQPPSRAKSFAALAQNVRDYNSLVCQEVPFKVHTGTY